MEFIEFLGKKSVKIITSIVVTLVFIVSFYLWLCYTDNSFVSKYRTLYIETACSTMKHQWLATALLPPDVVNPVVESSQKQFEENFVEQSEIAPPKVPSTFDNLVSSFQIDYEMSDIEIDKLNFSISYPEIDMSTMPEDIDYSNIHIKDIVDMGIKTTCGDSVWAIDTDNGILIIEVKGEGYMGKLAIIKDSSKVYLAVSKRNSAGQTVTDMCNSYGAVLGVNASGFVDPEGKGNAGIPIGIQISQGVQLQTKSSEGWYQICGFDENNNFRVGKSLPLDELRDAMQIYPILVLNGEKYVTGSYGLGIQPRCVIGQTIDKETLMLVIDGRQVHSLGTTMNECADILVRYNCWNAMNMDGGSSASMTYEGEMITKTSSPSKSGRYVPSCWVVRGKTEN